MRVSSVVSRYPIYPTLWPGLSPTLNSHSSLPLFPPPQPQPRLHRHHPGQQQVQFVSLRGPQPWLAEMVWRVISRSSRHHLDKFPRRRRCWQWLIRSNKLYKPDSLTSYRLCWGDYNLYFPPHFWWLILMKLLPRILLYRNRSEVLSSDE